VSGNKKERKKRKKYDGETLFPFTLFSSSSPPLTAARSSLMAATRSACESDLRAESMSAVVAPCEVEFFFFGRG